MTVAVNGRSRVEEGGGGEEGRGRQRYLERLFGVRSEGIERGSREEISRERLLPVRSRLRNNRRILCSFHESGRKGTRRIPYRSRDRHCHHLPFFFASSSSSFSSCSFSFRMLLPRCNPRISSNLCDTRARRRH